MRDFILGGTVGVIALLFCVNLSQEMRLATLEGESKKTVEILERVIDIANSDMSNLEKLVGVVNSNIESLRRVVEIASAPRFFNDPSSDNPLGDPPNAD